MSIAVGLRVGIQASICVGQDAIVNGTFATLVTTDLSTRVDTATTPWNATLTWHVPGTPGNSGVLDLHFVDGTPASAEVRDDELYNGVSWEAAVGTVGVLVTASAGVDEITVAEIEAAINATSELAQVTTADVGPTKEVDIASLVGQSATGSFSGGA